MKYLEKRFIRFFLKVRYPKIPTKNKSSKYNRSRGLKCIMETDPKTAAEIGIKITPEFILINPDNVILKSLIINTSFVENSTDLLKSLSNNEKKFLTDSDGKRARFFKINKKILIN